jgi:hypothetical protein
MGHSSAEADEDSSFRCVFIPYEYYAHWVLSAVLLKDPFPKQFHNIGKFDLILLRSEFRRDQR